MIIKLLEVVSTSTIKVIFPLVTYWWLVFVSVVANIAIVVGICCSVNVLTCMLIVIRITIWVESLTINIVEHIFFLLLCQEILLFIDREIIWFNIIVSCCRVCYWYSLKVIILLLKADSLFFIVVVGIKVLEASLIRNKLVLECLVILKPLFFLLIRKEEWVVILVRIVNIVDKESGFLISKSITLISLLLIKRLLWRHNSRLTKAQPLFLRF